MEVSAGREPGPVVLLTDFGTSDGYAASMKGVIAGLAPGCVPTDASHDIRPGDVGQASRTLARYWDRYPPGTVHLVVVDPGVGTDRRAIAVEADGRFLVAPDNGVLTDVLERADRWAAVELPAPGRGASATFHGRDVFAPAAARLAAGTPFAALGPTVADLIRLERTTATEISHGWEGSIVAFDRFGNAITNVAGPNVEGATIQVDGVAEVLRLVPSYGHVASGRVAAVINSDGVLEIAVRDASAKERLGLGLGAVVRVRREAEA